MAYVRVHGVFSTVGNFITMYISGWFKMASLLAIMALPPHDKQLQAAVRDAPWRWQAGILLFGAGAGW